jgi:peptidoglycan/xylan/chitin deacetylase (PgdA/CDA1 family)
MQELRKHWNPIGYQSITQLTADEPLPDNAVFISFDDGWRNNLTLAAPILAKYGIPATVFLTTDYIGTTGQLFWALEILERLIAMQDKPLPIGGQSFPLGPPESPLRTRIAEVLLSRIKQFPVPDRQTVLTQMREITNLNLSPKWKQELYEFLSWNEVRELKRQGWTIGCHTKTHPILSMLSAEEQRTELQEAKAKIEAELGETCSTLAYPNGGADDYNEETVRIAAELGFQTAFTLENKRNDLPLNDLLRIHRICITRDLTLNSFRAIISGIRGK